MTLFADRQREREREAVRERGGGVGGHNLKMYKKYIKRKSPCCLRVLSVFSTSHLPPLLHFVCVCVCVPLCLCVACPDNIAESKIRAKCCCCRCRCRCRCRARSQLCSACACAPVCVRWLLLRPFANVAQWARTRA